MTFTSADLSSAPEVVAPDGSAVRILPRLEGGSMAEFTLGPGQVSSPVRHRTVEEIWFVVEGGGELWRRHDDGGEGIAPLRPGTAHTIPLGTAFQFRCTSASELRIVATTMPPWPDTDDEAIPVADGPWEPRR